MKNNLYLVVGDNIEAINFNLHQILNGITYQEENKIEYDLNECTLSDILDEASMISFFSSNKVIIGNNFSTSKVTDDDYNYLSKYVENINKGAYIILITNKVDAREKIYKIFKNSFKIIDTSKKIDKEDLISYVKNSLKENKYKMNEIDIEYFISKVGDDVYNIDLELNKLYMYKLDSRVIDSKDIDLLIIDNIDNVIYEFTNAVLEKDIDSIVKMYEDFKKENITYDYIIASLVNTFHQVLIIKLLHNEGKSNLEISKVIGKKEFYVKKMLERIYSYSVNDLGNYITKLYEIDKSYKMGNTNYDMLEFFLIDSKRS